MSAIIFAPLASASCPSRVVVAAANSLVCRLRRFSVIAISGCIAGHLHETLPTSVEPDAGRPLVHCTPYSSIVSSASFSADGLGTIGSKRPSKGSHDTSGHRPGFGSQVGDRTYHQSVMVAVAAPFAQRRTASVSSSSIAFSGARASTRHTALSGIMFAAPSTFMTIAFRRQ